VNLEILRRFYDFGKFGKNSKTKKIARIKLSETQKIVATLVDNEKLDIGIWLNTPKYAGFTTRGLRFYLFDRIWGEFKKLVEKVDNQVKKLE